MGWGCRDDPSSSSVRSSSLSPSPIFSLSITGATERGWNRAGGAAGETRTERDRGTGDKRDHGTTLLLLDGTLEEPAIIDCPLDLMFLILMLKLHIDKYLLGMLDALSPFYFPKIYKTSGILCICHRAKAPIHPRSQSMSREACSWLPLKVLSNQRGTGSSGFMTYTHH